MKDTQHPHNQEVDKSRSILSKIIDCLKFCGSHELSNGGHDERDNSCNKGVFFSGFIESFI